MNFPLLFFLLITIFLQSACNRIQLTDDAMQKIQYHNQLAIAPVQVTNHVETSFYPGRFRGQGIASLAFQELIHSYIIENTDPDKYWFSVLPLDTTLFLLKDMHFYEDNSLTLAQICYVLDVDALISTKLVLDRYLPETSRDIERFGDYTPTNNSTAVVQIYDRRSRKILWTYYHRFSRALERSDEAFVEDLLVDIIHKIPYFTE